MMLKKKIFLAAGVFFITLTLFIKPAFCAVNRASEYLCELGVNFYKAGRYEDALLELKKAMMIDPNNKEAKKYTERIFKEMMPQAEAAKKIIPEEVAPRKEIKDKPKKVIKEPILKKELPQSVPDRFTLQQLINEAQKNIKIIDEKLGKQEEKIQQAIAKSQPPAPKPDKKALAEEKRQKQLELKKQQVMEKQLAAAEDKKK
jgi:tetratricopeptide (TPR) repeat protein